MLFPSLEYFLFFSFVFFFYWYILPLISNRKETPAQIFLLIVSYYFYMSWDYRFGALILISTLIDFYLALLIDKASSNARRLIYLNVSLFLNLVCILGFFKYYNFFSHSINATLPFFGLIQQMPILHIILPVGISFFTFQSLSYTIDVYRNGIPVERSLIRFALFVSFFPQLVAGPIVTAKTFLPQFNLATRLEEVPFQKAIRFFILGYVKKVIISDNIAPIVDLIFSSPETYSGASLWMGSMFFFIQLYGDFSGYTDMAYASALLLGYALPENFYMPFRATSITDFWRRWHISLGVWLKDYIYISRGGSKKGYWNHKFNLFLTFFLGGIWHGANWTFFYWGIANGLALALESVAKPFLDKTTEGFNKYKMIIFNFVAWVYAISFVVFTASIFRSANISDSAIILQKMIFLEAGNSPRPYMLKMFFIMIALVFIGHFLGNLIFEKKRIFKIPSSLEYAIYPFLFLLIAYFTNDNEAPFVYFQF